MIKVHCCICQKELDKPGGILLGVPADDWCAKKHICVEHMTLVHNMIIELRAKHGPREHTNVQVEGEAKA